MSTFPRAYHFGQSAEMIIRRLTRNRIESKPLWKPLHCQPVFQQYEVVGGDVSKGLNTSGICLPSSVSLPIEDLDVVIDLILEGHE